MGRHHSHGAPRPDPARSPHDGLTTLAALAAADLPDLRALAGVPGLGPRTLAKHGETLLRLIAAHPPDRYLLPTEPGHARMLERTDAGTGLMHERGIKAFPAK